MKEIILYGAGGHCFAAIELIKSGGVYSPSMILDDSPGQNEVLGIEVQRPETLSKQPVTLCVTIGNNLIRKRITEKYDTIYPIFIHETAMVYPSAHIGKGTLIHPHAVIDAAATINDFCIVNNNATVSHNVTIGNFVHVAIQAAISGGVTIGEGTLIGAGSVILPGIKIGKWVTIGAGSVITKDQPDYAVVYGNPGVIKNIIDK